MDAVTIKTDSPEISSERLETLIKQADVHASSLRQERLIASDQDHRRFRLMTAMFE